MAENQEVKTNRKVVYRINENNKKESQYEGDRFWVEVEDEVEANV